MTNMPALGAAMTFSQRITARIASAMRASEGLMNSSIALL
jgi:hypothetical protein